VTQASQYHRTPSPQGVALARRAISLLRGEAESPPLTLARFFPDDLLSKPERRNEPRKRKPSISRAIKQQQAERGDVNQASAILGLPDRTVQALALRGELPGAAKIGRGWTFDLIKLRRLVQNKERQTWLVASQKHRPDATGAGTPSGAVLRSVAGASDGRLTRLIRRSQSRVAKLAKPGS
jgi:Helix-turn-helix domain